jgi:hypothetical protein
VLRLKDFSLLHMDRDTFMWVDLKAFDIIEARTNEQLLTALMAMPAYRHDYCSPFDPADMDYPGPALHANWWLDRLAPSMFEAVDADVAVESVRAWAEDQDWVNGYDGPSNETRERLRDNVLSLFADGEVFKLHPPDDSAFHEYGGIVGGTGYHEFVVIDGERSVLHLIVATDD